MVPLAMWRAAISGAPLTSLIVIPVTPAASAVAASHPFPLGLMQQVAQVGQEGKEQ